MLPPCTSCVPSCSLFPRSPGGKVMLPPLASPQDSAITSNGHSLEGWMQAPVDLTTICLCRRDDCMCPSSSSRRLPLQHEPTGNCFNGVLNQRRSMNTHSDGVTIGPVTFSGQLSLSPPTLISSLHDQETTSPPTTTDITTSHQTISKAEPTSSVRTFRFKNSSTCGQNDNRRETKSPNRKSSPSDIDGSLKEINVTRRARRQIYLKPDMEDSPFRILMYVDCRSVEPQQELG